MYNYLYIYIYVYIYIIILYLAFFEHLSIKTNNKLLNEEIERIYKQSEQTHWALDPCAWQHTSAEVFYLGEWKKKIDHVKVRPDTHRHFPLAIDTLRSLTIVCKDL